MTFRFVAIGASRGGFTALKTVLSAVDEDFPVPIGVVQHRSHEDSRSFAPLLEQYTRLPVSEVDDKTPIRPGWIYVCPPNYHLLVDGDHFALSIDAPVLYARPSVDVFFESAAETFRDHLIGVVLTGMSRDGAAGLRKIKQLGGYAIVQDPSAAEGNIMPKAALAVAAVDKVLRLDEIAACLAELIRPDAGAVNTSAARCSVLNEGFKHDRR